MKYPVYSVKDELTGFLSPMVDRDDATAIRAFKHAVADPSSLMFSNKSDYRLYHVADWDTDTGTMTGCDPRLVVQASSFDEV